MIEHFYCLYGIASLSMIDGRGNNHADAKPILSGDRNLDGVAILTDEPTGKR